MSTVLKLTLASGEEHEVPFTTLSQLTVTTRVAGDLGGLEDKTYSYTEIVDVEIIDVETGEEALADDDREGLTSPAVAIHFAKGKALADAGAHIEMALHRWPDDEDLLQVWDDLSAAVKAGDDTWTTSVEPDPAALGISAPEEIPAGEEWLQSVEAAVEYINRRESVEAAAEAIDKAIERLGDQPELVAFKAQVDELLASRPGGPKSEKKS